MGVIFLFIILTFCVKKEEDAAAEGVAALSVEDRHDTRATSPVPGAPATATVSQNSVSTSGSSSVPTIAINDDAEEEIPLESGGSISLRVVKGKNLPPIAGAGKLKIICIIEYDKNEVTAEATNDDAAHPVFKTRAHFDVARGLCDVHVSLWGKTMNGKQIYIGSQHIRPTLTEGQLFENWLSLTNESGEPAGEIEVQYSFKKPDANRKMQMEDFQLLTVIGKGSFGKVLQVCKKDTGRIYAMKIIRKQNIVERDEVEHTIAERNVLARINHPFIVNLKFSFQTPEKLYLVLAFVNGGELFKHLQDEGQFEESRSKFYAAELLLALDHLHSYNIVYRYVLCMFFY